MSTPIKPALNDVLQWEVRSWSRALKFWEQNIPATRPIRALGIGERDGGLSLWFASKGIDVVCTDLDPFPAATRKMHDAYGVSDRIYLDRADATSLRFPDQSFDIIFFKSVIGALCTKEKQLQAIQEFHRVLKPGGLLCFAENLSGTLLHGYLRKRFVAWNSYWRYLHSDHDRDLFNSFRIVNDRTNGLIANLGRSETQRDLLARIDGMIAPMVPSHWRTIWYGVAIK
ncbi:MAG: class I SAM-dependent methyltransferase [Bacteroidota bacterium]|nr:class I SAM-dependent methyltransferase [Bacteroidota bacterium]